MSACPNCGAERETPLWCGGCETLFDLEGAPTPFEVLGLPRSYGLDAGELRKRLLRLTRAVHPDFHGASDEATRLRSERASAELNAAHELLADDFRRATTLVRLLGGPSEAEERQMPAPFLAEVLEWNETLEEARAAAPGSAERGALDALETELRARRDELMSEVGSALAPLPPPGDARLVETRKRLNAVRYVDRALDELAELRLDHASTRP